MSSTEVRMVVGKGGKLHVSVSVGKKHIVIGEMRKTDTGPQFTSSGMDLWITPDILEGMAVLLRQVQDQYNETGVFH